MKTSFSDSSRKKQELPEYETWSADPTPENYSKALKALDPIIDSAIQSFGSGNASLRTRAKIIAAQSLQSFDKSRGASLRTHVYNNLQALNRVKAERNFAVHVPENVLLEKTKINRFVQDYTAENGYDPTDLEVADGVGLSIKKIRKARWNLEVPQSSQASDKGDDVATQRKAPEDVWVDYVYHDLSPVNRKILEWTTGYGGVPMIPKNEIAKRLKITPAAVSMRVGTIAKRLSEVQARGSVSGL